MAAYYKSNHWHFNISKIATEGARNHGLLNLSPRDFFNTTLSFPQNKNEQKI